jgi:hypothetical protein
MRSGARLSLLLAVALASALAADASAAGPRTSRPARTWRAAARGKRAPLVSRKVRRLRPLRRPRVVATASSSDHHPALGLAGPLGPYGPLGRLGPVVDTAWSPTRWMRAVGDWSHSSAILTELGGPLSEDGPLGPGGPLGTAHDRFPSTFLAGGALAALGPDGPLGARGPLGPLGPMGAHGFARDAHGRYLDGRGKVRRTVTVPYQGGRRTYPLFEVYDADFAAAMNDNDTSFMAVGSLRRGASYSFPFRSPEKQNLQVSLTPHAQLDRFHLEIVDGAGNVVASSEAGGQVNRVELFVPARTRLQARVTLASSGHLLADKPFSLAVVGAPAN